MYVKWVDCFDVHIERTVVEKRTLRDLVRKSRQMGDSLASASPAGEDPGHAT